MDEVKKQVENLYLYVGEIKKTIEENSISNVKVLSYLLNKTNDIDEQLKTINSILTSTKADIAVNEADTKKLKAAVEKLSKANDATKASIDKTNSTVSTIDKTIEEKLKEIHQEITTLEGSKLSSTDYVIVKKDRKFYRMMSSVWQALYTVTHIRKIKKAEKEAELARIEAEKIAEQKRIEAEEQKRIAEEQKKIKAANEMKNILRQGKK